MNKLILTLFLTMLSFAVADSAFALGGGGGGGGGVGGGVTVYPGGVEAITENSPFENYGTYEDAAFNGQLCNCTVVTTINVENGSINYTNVLNTYDGGGGSGDLVCIPTTESCETCTEITRGDRQGQFTQTCTDGCRQYEKACTPPPSCVPTGVKTYGPCSATACGTTGTRTVTDSCNKALPDEVCSTPPCNICIPDCSQANQVCAGKTFDDPNRCVDNGKDQCTGTRSCDYNWKEVAP